MKTVDELMPLLNQIKKLVKHDGYNAMEATLAVGEAIDMTRQERRDLWDTYTSMPSTFFDE